MTTTKWIEITRPLFSKSFVFTLEMKKGYRFMFQFDVGCQSSESKNKRVSWFIQWILLKEKSRRDLEPIARYDTRYASLPLFPPAKLLGFKRSSVGYHSNFSFCSLIPLNSYEKAFSSAGHKTWKVPRPEPDRNIKWQIGYSRFKLRRRCWRKLWWNTYY